MPTSAERAYRFIRSSILGGHYASGARLKELEIASELAISRTPVRDAIRRLHSDGLIEFEPNQGARVASWSEVDLAEISEMRALLESFAAELAATKITEDGLAELDAQVEDMADALDGPVPHVDGVSSANIAFHQGIVRAAGNARLATFVESLWVLPLLTRKFALFDRDRLERSLGHHREIVSALRARDGAWAAAIMRTHILSARAYDAALARLDADFDEKR